MCITFIVLSLENTKLFYILLLFCLYIEILAVLSLFICLIAIKCSEIRVETLQIFDITILSSFSSITVIQSFLALFCLFRHFHKMNLLSEQRLVLNFYLDYILGYTF